MTAMTLTAYEELPLNPASAARLPRTDARKPVSKPLPIDHFIHSLDGKIKLEKPLTITAMNEIIAAGWAGELVWVLRAIKLSRADIAYSLCTLLDTDNVVMNRPAKRSCYLGQCASVYQDMPS